LNSANCKIFFVYNRHVTVGIAWGIYCQPQVVCAPEETMRNDCLWQATLRRNTNPDPRLDPEAAKKKLGDMQLTAGSKAIFVGRSHFGCVATIIPDASRGLSKQVQLTSLLI